MKSITVIPKKSRTRGRPATGRDPVIAIRLSEALRDAIGKKAKAQKISRSEAIRLLIQKGLKS